MTASAPIPAAESVPHMPNPTDTTPTTPRNQVPSQVQTAAATPTLRSQVDAKFEDIDARLDGLDLKLTALIAKLDATDDVDAAIEGRLREPA